MMSTTRAPHQWPAPPPLSMNRVAPEAERTVSPLTPALSPLRGEGEEHAKARNKCFIALSNFALANVASDC